MEKPYLSIVIASRNDDEGRSLQRLQTFIFNLISQRVSYKLNSELIIVEWNPPNDRPPLKNALKIPKKQNFCKIRIITVPYSSHKKLDNWDKLPMFQMIAKNVGIRRARGRFVLATNMDIIFSGELIEYFASERLKEGFFYRIDRHDISSDITKNLTSSKRLSYCQKNIIRLNTIYGTQDIDKAQFSQKIVKKRSFLYLNEIKQVFGLKPFIYTNASGDFTLMSFQDWDKTHGYAEFCLQAFKVDGLLLHVAYHTGIRQRVLSDPLRIYHIEHLARLDGLAKANNSNLLILDRKKYNKCILEMETKDKPIYFNQSTEWGLVKEKLEEYEFD